MCVHEESCKKCTNKFQKFRVKLNFHLPDIILAFDLQADVFDPVSLAPIFKGHDVVVSVLGFHKQLEGTMTKFTESMSAILKAMKDAGVARVVTISAWYTDPKTRVGQFMFDEMWTKVPGKHLS